MDAWNRDEARMKILALLEANRRRRAGDRPRVFSARRLAWACGVAPGCSNETRKRRVRELIDDLRDDGVPVVSVEGSPGYWIAENITDRTSYEAALERHGIRRILQARAARRSAAGSDAAGQLGLFAA